MERRDGSSEHSAHAARTRARILKSVMYAGIAAAACAFALFVYLAATILMIYGPLANASASFVAFTCRLLGVSSAGGAFTAVAFWGFVLFVIFGGVAVLVTLANADDE
jgi:hypothetical protein